VFDIGSGRISDRQKNQDGRIDSNTSQLIHSKHSHPSKHSSIAQITQTTREKNPIAWQRMNTSFARAISSYLTVELRPML
jgi:hypothetical protein